MFDKLPLGEVPKRPKVNRDERSFDSLDDAQLALYPLGLLPIDPRVRNLFKQLRFEQRSDAWFDARFGAITASDFAAAIGQNDWSSATHVVKKKNGLVPKFTGNKFTAHGVENEDRALHAYEEEMARRGTPKHTLDFGLLSHHRAFEKKPKYMSTGEWHELIHRDERDERFFTEEEWIELKDLLWLKGSPDGITTDGILIEIKCPSKQIVKQTISKHYYPQVQLLMELTDLNECHFVQYRPQTSWLFKEELDILVVKRDRDWMKEQKEVARQTWNAVLECRETKQVPRVVNAFLRKRKRTDSIEMEYESQPKRRRKATLAELYDFDEEEAERDPEVELPLYDEDDCLTMRPPYDDDDDSASGSQRSVSPMTIAYEDYMKLIEGLDDVFIPEDKAHFEERQNEIKSAFQSKTVRVA